MRHYLTDGERVVVVYDITFDSGSCGGTDLVTYRDGKIAKFEVFSDTAMLERVYGPAQQAGPASRRSSVECSARLLRRSRSDEFEMGFGGSGEDSDEDDT